MGDVVRTPWSAGSPACGRRWRSFQKLNLILTSLQGFRGDVAIAVRQMVPTLSELRIHCIALAEINPFAFLIKPSVLNLQYTQFAAYL